MSAINTGSINPNYPVPGVNNSTQGFRDNFQSIKNNLDTAASEISQLQSKSILKSALSGVPLDNNMANTLISNASVRTFRAPTHSIGNNLSGAVTVFVTNGDVQVGTITANTALGFQAWAPAGTQSNVQLILNIANSSAVISLPSTVTDGATTLEGYSGNGTGGIITVPPGVTTLHYNFTTINCGNNIEVQPLNRPRTGSGGGGGGSTPGGSNSTVQYNFQGNLAGNTDFVYTAGNQLVRMANVQVTGGVVGNLLPAANNAYDLGSPTQQWRALYVTGNTMYLGTQSISTLSANGVTGVAVSNLISNQLIGNTLYLYEGAELGYVQDVNILGGTSGQFLQTDGNGHLSWSDFSVNAVPAIYFTTSIPGNNQEFSNVFLSSYESNTDMTVFKNGQLLENDTYTLLGNTLTVNVELDVSDQIQVIRQLASNVISPLIAVPSVYFTAVTAGNNTTYSNVFLGSYTNPNDMSVYLNGSLLGNGFYTLNEYTMTVTTPVEIGDSIIVQKTYAANVLPAPTAQGSNTQVQFNDNFALAGNSQMTFNKVTGTFTANVIQGNLRVTALAPATSTSAGQTGDFAIDGGYVYFCVAPNVWKRAALATW